VKADVEAAKKESARGEGYTTVGEMKKYENGLNCEYFNQSRNFA
jgi:hypothetical protein